MTDFINNEVEYNVRFFNYKNSYYPSNVEGQRIVDAVTGQSIHGELALMKKSGFLK